jgi:hypothetical protein
MKLSISTKHSIGSTTGTVPDGMISEHTPHWYVEYPDYITIRNGQRIVYIRNGDITSWTSSCGHSQSFAKGTVVTLTQQQVTE